MSGHGIHFGNEPQNSKQNTSKNFFERESLLSSEFSTISGEWVNSFINVNFEDQPEGRIPRKIDGWRRAVREDKNAIRELQNLTGDLANLLYRSKSLDEFIENSYFTLVQYDTKGDLISFTVYDSYPNLPFNSFWTDWLNENYKIRGVNSENAFFVHYMVWRPEYEQKFLPLLLETCFTEFLHLKQIIIIQPPRTDIPEFYKRYFIPVYPVGLNVLETSSVQLIRSCLRASIVPPLFIRTAFENDFEVILPVVMSNMKKELDRNSPDSMYFYDFLFQKDKKTLICECNGQVAGVMTLNLTIDLDILNERFELGPFNCFRKKTTENDLSSPELPLKNIKPSESSSLLMSTNLLLSLANWDVSVNQNESVSTRTGSLTSSTDNFSFYDFSSIIDFKKISETPAISASQAKSEAVLKLGEPSITIRPPEMTITHFFPPKYSGPSNAFLIDFFAIDSDSIDEKLSFFDFLKAAFKIIPDREYCFILTSTSFLQYKFLDLLVRAPPKPMSSFKQELYLCHRNSFSVVSMHVRSTEHDDLEGIENFLKNVNDGDTVYRDILECFEEEKNQLKSFVFTYEQSIIGVSLISSEDYDEHFRTYFEVPASQFSHLRRPNNSSVIKHLVISPMFNNHARSFIRDLMSLTDVSYLYYVGNCCKNHKNLLTVVGEFAPVKPKEKVEVKNFSIFYGKETHDCRTSMSLRILYPRLCGFHRIHLNLVLVVVGASRTSTSFLESLIFGPEGCYYNFNNIICVSPRGFDTEEVEDNIKTFMFAHKDNVSKNYKSMLSLHSYVSCIYGYVTQINRSEKFIVVNNKSTVRYDYLVLTCGLQYLSPVPEAQVKIKPKQTCKRTKKKFSKSEEDIEYIPPRNLHNLFIVNTLRDAQYAISGVQVLVDKLKLDGRKIIVYGYDIHAFLTINTLLKLGIPGEAIAFVEPFPKKNSKVTLFNDPNVDQAVIELLKESKVNYYTEYFLYDWSVNSEDYITTIKFHSNCNQMVIPCVAFFSFIDKLVSDVTFNACTDAGLVYDGRLVINHNFRTNDKYIYAAGPLTKYARRYYANEFDHRYYDSREVGQKLAAILNGKLNPLVEDETKETSELVPRLKKPVFYYCQLPGELNLFSLKQPGKEVSLETAINLHDYGEVLTTGDFKKNNSNYNYFRLHLDPHGFVASITCFSRNKIDYLNLYCLYGLHERMLNNLLMHFDLAMIPDFFEYFRQPWTAVIYHNNFQYLRQRNYETFFEKITDRKTFYELVSDELEEANWLKLNDSSNELLELEYQYSNIHDDVKTNLIDFLEIFKDDLPEYATPSKLEKLFRKKVLSLTTKQQRDDAYLQSDTILPNKNILRRKPSSDFRSLSSDSKKVSRTTFTLDRPPPFYKERMLL